jgi:GntR family transcriptional repressor for pyruvate dehydrogenase complex
MTEKTEETRFESLRKDLLSDKIVHSLLGLIKERQLRPGDRLPPERELAAMMKVSRPSLREALRALAIMNIIDNRQGSGTYVTKLEPERLVEHLDVIFTLNDSTYIELLEARKILEAGIAELAAREITDEEIDGLEACLKKARAAVDDSEAFLEIDLDLHGRIVDASRNRILGLFMRSIGRLGIYSRRRTAEHVDVRQKTIEDHDAIVSALKARDPQGARRAMLDHLSYVQRRVREMQDAAEE